MDRNIVSPGNRRNDLKTSRLVGEALQMQRAFDTQTATRYLKINGRDDSFAKQVLALPYDRRRTVVTAW